MWNSLHCHSEYSLLDGLPSPDDVAGRLKEIGVTGGALSDHGSVSGIPSFFKAMEKRGLKAIAANEMYICKQDPAIRDASNKDRTHLVTLARSAAGWKNLMRASAASYHPDFFYYKPRLNLERLAAFGRGEFIVFSGHMGSDLADVCFAEPKKAYRAFSVDDARSMLHPDCKQRVEECIRKYQGLFGKENFFVEIQLIDRANLPASEVVAQALRDAAIRLGVPRVATADSHYCRREDATDQRLLICTALRTTLREVARKLESGEDVTLGGFFRSNNYHIPTVAEMKELHDPEELANAVGIADRCEAYSLGSKPLLPKFVCPDGQTSPAHLRELCRGGWRKKIAGKIPAGKLPEYTERVKHELDVLCGAGLSDYFLIVQDYLRYAREDLEALLGRGRGSSGGCMVSYLSDITEADPIEYDLLFERFYNVSRTGSLPDIDSDFPVGVREAVIDYLRKKYGENRVAQMATFGRMQGRGAMKDVLRAHGTCGFEEMNRITAGIPGEAEIADQLQEMVEDGDEASIITWALRNNANDLREWCFLNDEGECEGPFAGEFAQAIRLEGTRRSMGRHASGIIVSSVDLADVCPMVYDKESGQLMTGVGMQEAEYMGLVKFDILGLRALDKMMSCQQMIRTGR